MKFSIAVTALLSASSAAAFQAQSSSGVARNPLHAVAMDPFTIAAPPKARQERVEIDMTGVALSVSMSIAWAYSETDALYQYHHVHQHSGGQKTSFSHLLVFL